MAKNERFEDGKAWQQARVLTNSLYAVTETGTFCNRQQKVEHRLISRKGAKKAEQKPVFASWRLCVQNI